MTLPGRIIAFSALVAAAGALALLAANNPEAFSGAASPGSAALEAALYRPCVRSDCESSISPVSTCRLCLVDA